MKKYDLVIVGGGFAGIGAALSATRNGIKVLLIEKSNALGGASVNCLVNPFMPYSTVVDGRSFDLSQGIFKEIHKRLEERNAIYYESFLEEELKLVLNEMALEAGVDLLFHAYLSKVNRQNDKIESVIVATIGGEIEITADYFIDATGDAQLAFLSNCPTVQGRDEDNLCQPMTLCFRLGNVDVDRFFEGFEELKKKHAKSLENGELLNPRENILVFKTPIKNVLHFNTTRVVKKNPTSPIEVTEAEILGRKQVHEIYEFMKKYGKGLENSFLMMTGAEIGIRESRRIVGDYTLTEEDCKNCVKFEDSIVACNYDIDIHNPEGTGTSHHYFKAGEYYTIPYRSLIPQGIANMLVAGRCISSDHGAQASYRIMPVVCCIGEAAGSAMALAVKKKCSVREISINELQSNLKSNGAYIGK